MPTHPVLEAYGFSGNRFQYVWRNLHLDDAWPSNLEILRAEEEPEDEDMDEDEFGLDSDLYYGSEAEDDAGDDDGNESDESSGSYDAPPPAAEEDPDWYKRVKLLLEHVMEVSKEICLSPHNRLSIDEMMARFKGRSKETFRMQCKPISEGYKLWCLCDRNGYVYHIIPCGRVSGRKHEKEIAPMVEEMAKKLPDKDTKCYIVAMDNLFTTKDAKINLKNANIGVLGTMRSNNVDPELTNVKDDTYNSVHWIVDEAGTIQYRWVDNGVVYMVRAPRRCLQT